MQENILSLAREIIKEMKLYGYEDYPNSYEIINKHPFVSKINSVRNIFGQGYASPSKDYKTGIIDIRNFDSKTWDKDIDTWFIPSLNKTIYVDYNNPYNKEIANRFVLPHELAHLYKMLDNPWKKRINKEMIFSRPNNGVNSLETFCDILSTYFLFPPEEYFDSAKNDIEKLSCAPSFLEGLINLSNKRNMDLFSLNQRLANSNLFKDKFQNNFSFFFSYIFNENYPKESRAWRLLPGDSILPKGVYYKNYFNWPFEYSLFTQNVLPEDILKKRKFPIMENLPDPFLDSFGLTEFNLGKSRWGKLEEVIYFLNKENSLTKFLNLDEHSLLETKENSSKFEISELNFCGSKGLNFDFLCIAGKVST
jgi:hypothetical protein